MKKRAWMMAMVLAGMALCGEAPAQVRIGVTKVEARQRYPWNGLVDISCRVVGIEGVAEGVRLAVEAVEESGRVRRVPHVRLVREGTESDELVVQESGEYELVWDARADMGAGLWSNLTVRVKTDNGVQLWAGGPYWAETNLGASEPWKYGLYFGWGDTVGYQRKGNAWVASDGSSTNFSFGSVYVPTWDMTLSELKSEGWVVLQDGTYVLAPEHDAAQVQWGRGWRMPTKSELSALCSKCVWTWTTTNGVKGHVVRGKGDFADASIFIPAAGNGYGASLYGVGSTGYVWSGSGDSDSAWNLGFNNNDEYDVDNEYDWFYGLSIRPVRESAE